MPFYRILNKILFKYCPGIDTRVAWVYSVISTVVLALWTARIRDEQRVPLGPVPLVPGGAPLAAPRAARALATAVEAAVHTDIVPAI